MKLNLENGPVVKRILNLSNKYTLSFPNSLSVSNYLSVYKNDDLDVTHMEYKLYVSHDLTPCLIASSFHAPKQTTNVVAFESLKTSGRWNCVSVSHDDLASS